MKRQELASLVHPSFGNACNLFTSAMAAVPSILFNERLVQRFAFYIDAEQDMACNLHVVQKPLTKSIPPAPGNMGVTGDLRNPQSRGRSATTNLNSPQ
jgi:hypothetical protein